MGETERGRLPEVISLSWAPEIQKPEKLKNNTCGNIAVLGEKCAKRRGGDVSPSTGWSPLGHLAGTPKSIKNRLENRSPKWTAKGL